MSCQYTDPYKQNTSGYTQTDMNKVQGNAGYMNGQTQRPMSQMPAAPRMMQDPPPAGTTPLARQMPMMPGQGAAPMPQMPPRQGTMGMPQMPSGPGTPGVPQMPSGMGTAVSPPLSSLAGTVPITSSITPLAASMPRTPGGPETPVTVASPYYTAGFLRNFIGKNVRVEFVLGTAGSINDRIGTLLEVGASYIVIQPLLTDDLLMCDLYSIRFVTIIG